MVRLFEQNTYNIEQKIKPNNRRSIKGHELESVLKDVVDSGNVLKYSTKREYIVGCVCLYDNAFWLANTTTSGIFNASDWDEIIVT